MGFSDENRLSYQIYLIYLHQKINVQRKILKVMNTTVAKRIEFLNNFKAKRNNNTIVLFRDMDFYFMYNEDAENVGKILGATGKIAHAEDFTFGAFASSKLDAYLPVIIRKGYRVAICDGEF